MSKDEWKKFGEVCVDSGTLLIGDPCYYLGDEWSEEKYQRNVCTDWRHFKQLKNDFKAPIGLIFSSGFGDGVYEVFGKIKEFDDWGKRVTEVKIVLIDDDETKFGELKDE